MATRSTDEREPTDLAQLTRELARCFRDAPPAGYLVGKTAMRDALMDFLGCSALRAEELVDQLQAMGYIEYTGDPREAGGGRAVWTVTAYSTLIE